MAADVDICNQALSHLGQATEIQDLENEKFAAARACRRFYDDARDQALRDFPWPFATASGALALVAENPTTEWAYAYRMPADALAFRRLVAGRYGQMTAFGTPVDPVTYPPVPWVARPPFRIAGDAGGQLIYTDWQDAVGEWTTRVEDPTQYPPDFRLALSFLLASLIAPRVTGGDQFKLGLQAFQRYVMAMQNASANAVNQEQPDPAPDAEWIRARDL